MEASQTGALPLYLTTIEAAHLLRLSPRTLEKHRVYGTGSAYRKLGGRAIYVTGELVDWADTGAKASTSDPRQGPSAARRPAGSTG